MLLLDSEQQSRPIRARESLIRLAAFRRPAPLTPSRILAARWALAAFAKLDSPNPKLAAKFVASQWEIRKLACQRAGVLAWAARRHPEPDPRACAGAGRRALNLAARAHSLGQICGAAQIQLGRPLDAHKFV